MPPTRRLLAVVLGVLGVMLAIAPVTDRAHPGTAPAQKTFAVGTRVMVFDRGADRPLPTMVWYPSAPGTAGVDAPIAGGTFPLVLYSHGLASLPIDHGQVAIPLARAGFVVAAPAYPRTNKHFGIADRADIANQPADASAVITALLAPGGPLHGSVDPARVAAAGHSAGGTTTNGLLAASRDVRVRAGVVIAGRPLGDYHGPAAPVLFVHGDADPVVTYDNGRAAYDRVPWPKAFLTLVGQQHGEYLGRDNRGNAQTITTIVDFLRWALDGDLAALGRLDAGAALAGVTRFERELPRHQ